jgi:hypothetical protein
MKTILIVLFLSFSLISCEKTCFTNEIIHGSGENTTEIRKLAEFSKIESRIGANINIIRSNNPEISITVQPNLIPYIHTNVINGKLIITTGEYTIRTLKSITIDIEIPMVEEIVQSGAGDIRCDCPVSRIVLCGAGNISCKGECSSTNVRLSGSGNVDLLGMFVKQGDVNISGSGNVKMNASEHLDVSISGFGNVYYKGSPYLNKEVSGIGSIICID